ncbi:hypothetical protein ACIBEA_42985 [Streptomyces sp. NPDC051555]|uniref:hypothetical protein n=1 Tax=Streptomyces sp. NPDC051555 TaxID=3365657 RepID=UPI00379B760B
MLASPAPYRPPTLADLFPLARDATGGVEVPVGPRFEIAALPEAQARRVITLLAHREPYPVGAVLARHDDARWLFFLPPGSAEGLNWAAPFSYTASGVVWVPPVPSAGPVSDGAGTPRWVRFGNPDRRAFTAPLVLYAVTSLLSLSTDRARAAAVGARRTHGDLRGRGVCHV